MSSTYSYKNPFRAYRAEQLESVWKFYVNKPFDNLLGPKPLIYEGGRGSGKTMFYLCNSWEQRLEELEAHGESPNILFTQNSFVGIYYRTDAPFIGSFYGKGIDSSLWSSIFSTYFNIVICKEISRFLKKCLSIELFEEVHLNSIYELFTSKLTHQGKPDKKNDIIEMCNHTLDAIEQFANHPNPDYSLPLFSPGTLIKAYIEIIRQIPCFSKASFHVFVDEYETLDSNQQSQINTLIKMSEYWLVYDIGVKNKGAKTHSTSNDELIQSPHDFVHFKPETGISISDYKDLLVDICRKRFNEYVQYDHTNEVFSDIKYYLGEYSIEEEIKRLEADVSKWQFKNNIKEIIEKQIGAESEHSKYYNELAECNLLNARMHLCLLLRGEKEYSVESVYEEYQNWKEGESKIYKDWLHNMKFAIIFLLVAEAPKIRKQYYGFEVFSMLSSGVIRYFLELCEHAFDFASSKGFKFEVPQPLSPEVQSNAARYVSRYKITDIEWFRPHGFVFRRFVKIVGNIMKELHINSNLTLGEPEPNHFYTKTTDLTLEAQDMLTIAARHNILQERLTTKEKESELPTEATEYHLNHIYCPYYGISYRRKRRIFIEPNELQMLFNGSDKEAKEAAKSILARHKVLSSNKDMLSGQMDLFESRNVSE